MFAKVCVFVEDTVVSVVFVNPLPPVVVNADAPLPPTGFFSRTMAAGLVLLKVHVTVPPAATVMLPGDPLSHDELDNCQPACAVSAMLKVCVGSTFENVCAAVEAE